MAIAPIRIPTLTQAQPIVDTERKATNEFLRTMNGVLGQIGYALNQILILPIIQQAIEDLGDATAAAQAAADAASAAAEAANAAAAGAASNAAANAREAALQSSYIDPNSVLTATPDTITIAAHTRRYSDGTSVAVSGGTIAATAPDDVDYIYYDDPTRAGGSVTFQVSTTQPIQTGDRHVVEAILIPPTGTAEGGGGPRPPGYVINKFAVEPEV